MVNNKLIAERIGGIIEDNNLSASAFASAIGVQRSSISHILSGRNNPSLDLLLKIHKTFKDISLEWLILGHEHDENLSRLGGERNVSKELGSIDNSGFKLDSELKEIVYHYKDGSFERFFPIS